MQRLDNDDVELENVENAINQYLQQYPQAADTVEGIAKWWLPRFEISLPLESVRRVLEKMVAAGKLNRLEKHDGSVIYTLVQRKH